MPIANPTNGDAEQIAGLFDSAEIDDDLICVVHRFGDYTNSGVRSSTKCGWPSKCEIHTLKPNLTIEEAADLADISARLAAVIKVIGKSQREIADEIGVTEQAFSNWAQGIRSPGVNVARRLKRRYGVTLDYLYDGDFNGLSMGMANLLRSAEGAASSEQNESAGQQGS